MQKNPVGTQSPLKCVAMWCIVKHLWSILGFREKEKMWTFALGAMLKQKLVPLDGGSCFVIRAWFHKIVCVWFFSWELQWLWVSFYPLLSFATMQANREGQSFHQSVWWALPNLQLKFIKSYVPKRLTYPVQSRHWVAWQQLHLRNPAGSQSEAASMQHGGAWTKQVSAGFSYLMTVTHLKG